MDLSIVIVNYNVKYFLKQCLDSVMKATENLKVEVYVVDNNSKDGSNEMVKKDFKKVILIENKVNVGFSRANNQAIRIAKGKYVLLLNPDTVVAEDTFTKVVDFMNETADAGGLGVRMVDGNGDFLPESKRGLPTPEVAFYKIFGFSALFPKSKLFGKYHLGNLNEFEINRIDILSGAFMLLRKETLDKVGLLDENFFMYGEDIDLSYRITLGGYHNYYFPNSTIIHYKGESTKKSSVNYVFIFYKAMAIFAEKHFGRNKASMFSFLIKIAIFFRAGLALFNRFIEILFLPIVDFSAVFFGLHIAKRIYQEDTSLYHDSITANLGLFSLAATFLICLFFSGAYDKPVRLKAVLVGLILSVPIVFLEFSFAKNQFLFDFPVAFLTIMVGAIGIIALRFILHFTRLNKFKSTFKQKRVLLIGYSEELNQTENLVELTQPHSTLDKYQPVKGLFEIDSIKELFIQNKLKKPNEVIFCSGQISYKKIIQLMCENKNNQMEFKIAHSSHNFIIGSTNLNTSGELYTLQLKGIRSQQNKRLKRTLDLGGGILLFFFSPFYVFLLKNKASFYKNLWKVIRGKSTFVGYNNTVYHDSLPYIKNGILSWSEVIEKHFKRIDPYKLNKIYARDYSVFRDIKIVCKGFKKLDKLIS